MSLVEYRDPFVAGEAGDQFGTYEKSYQAAGGMVEIHLFRSSSDEIVAFVTKNVGFPAHLAVPLAKQALAAVSAIERSRIVFDAGSFVSASGSR
ncbi:MAG: hypothetical protein KDC95_22805 [Planctomycetes bacterium]|nr:hypothetical protein [Planctomycetota bacterium]